MSVIDPVIGTVDNENKLIYLADGVREYHPIDDLYKEIRNLRRLNEPLRKFDVPIKAAGALPKGGGKYTPRYAIFQNGWKVVPQDTNHSLFVSGEQITDDGQSGPACINTDVLSAGTSVIIQYQPPAAELIKAEDELVAIQRMAFDEVISVNFLAGTAGTVWPTGTLGQPVNNMEDALSIAAYQGINTLSISDDVELGIGQDYTGLSFVGASKTKTNINILGESQVNGCEFSQARITGDLDGDAKLKDCLIGGLTHVNGFIENCTLESAPILLSPGGLTYLIDCMGGSSVTTYPTIDMDGAGASVVMKNYNGTIAFINKTGPESVCVDLSSGMVLVDMDTVTEGSLIVGGIGKVLDLTTRKHIGSGTYGGFTVFNNAVSHDTIAEGVWDEPISNHLIEGTTGHSVGASQFGGQVHIHSAGVSGTEFPIGTMGAPVNNLTDALTIARGNGIVEFNCPADYTILATDVIDNMHFLGAGSSHTKLTFEPGCITANCRVTDCTVTGLSLGLVLMQNCRVSDYGGSGVVASDKGILLKNSAIEGNLNLPGNYTGIVRMVNCYSVHSPTDIPSVNYNGGSMTAIVEGFSGELSIKNCTSADAVTSIDLLSGHVTLDSTVEAGKFTVRGVGTLTDNSTGNIDIDSSALINKDAVSDNVWAHSTALELITDVEFTKDISGGKWAIENNQMIFYKDDNVTEVARVNLFDAGGVPTMNNPMSRERV